jgi:predicted MFS family arabinose efflux permease
MSSPTTSPEEQSEAGITLLLSGSSNDSQEANAATSVTEPDLSKCQLALLNSYMVGWSALWTCLYVVTLPKQVLGIICSTDPSQYNFTATAPSSSSSITAAMCEGNGKGAALALVIASGGPAQLILPPLFGYISDNTYTQWGSRRPFVMFGMCSTCICVLLLPACESLGTLCLVWFCLQVASNIGSTAFFALIADVVPNHQFGSGSGMMGAFSCVGQFFGAAIGVTQEPLGFGGCYALLVALHFTTTVPTLWYVDDRDARGPLPREAIGKRFYSASLDGLRTGSVCQAVSAVTAPFLESPDFAWVFVTRLLFNMGQYTVQEFLQYYLKDLIDTGGIPDSTAVSYLLMPMLLSAAVTAYVGGIASDRMDGRRKIFVYVSGAIMALCNVVSMFNRSYGLTFLVCILFGSAFGLFGSIDFALVCDVLPKDNVAKDMGLWHIALVVPQFIAVPIAGGILDSLLISSGPSVGYSVVFGIAAAYFVVGSILVSKIKGAK